jgi:hypothetical protein
MTGQTTSLEAARSYAARNPGDLRHRTLLDRAEAAPGEELTAAITRALGRPEVIARLADALAVRRARVDTAAASRPAAPVLNLAAARAAMTATSTPVPSQERRTAPARPIALHAVRTTARQPEAPVHALRSFAADGTLRWAAADVEVSSAPEWESLAARLVAAGPFRSLHITAGHLTTADAETRFQHDAQGAEWVTVVVDRRLTGNRARRVIGHELAHVADEIARVELTASLDTWRRTFAHPHRTAQAEAFACEAEEWVDPHTRAADLIAAARRHQEQRGPRR